MLQKTEDQHNSDININKLKQVHYNASEKR